MKKPNSAESGDDLLSVPSPARMYDYLLGGYHNFAVDRAAAEAATAIYPDLPHVMQANRAFLRRGVMFLLEQGIDQFLDIGSGIPSAGNVHEIAQAVNPNAHVVYVDLDPIAVSQSTTILQGNANAAIVQLDARQPATILAHPRVQQLIDFKRPLAVLLVAVLHFMLDDADAHRVVRELRDALPSGSYMVIGHGTADRISPEVLQQLSRLYSRTTDAAVPRTKEQVAAFFEALTLVEPGIVFAPLWRPEENSDLFLDEPERSANYVGVGRKP